MGKYEDGRDAHEQIESGQHEGKLSHELLGAGASFLAMREFEKHQESQGKTVNHALAKELLAGFAGGAVDKLVESKGLDYVDAEKAKYHARQQANEAYDEKYNN